MFVNIDSFLFQTAVSEGLTTAGLFRRVVAFYTKFFQQFKRGNTYLRVKLINITGDKEADFHFRYFYGTACRTVPT